MLHDKTVVREGGVMRDLKGLDIKITYCEGLS